MTGGEGGWEGCLQPGIKMGIRRGLCIMVTASCGDKMVCFTERTARQAVVGTQYCDTLRAYPMASYSKI